MTGWIKLHREIREKAIWTGSTPGQKIVLITLLTMVNFEENEWEWKRKSYKTKPGQVITSLDSIARECGKGITARMVRTALNRFVKYDFLSNETSNENRLITITNWEYYQGSEIKDVKQKVKQRSGNGQATVKQQSDEGHAEVKDQSTIKNDNNEKKKLFRLPANPLKILY
jgi:DNA replication protein DnaD